MRNRLLEAVITGILGAACAAAAWWAVFLGINTIPDAFLFRLVAIAAPVLEYGSGSSGFVIGCIGGGWLGRNHRRPVLWMLAGGAVVGLTWFALVSVEPIDSIGWRSFATPAIGGFLAAFAARATPGHQPVQEHSPLADAFSWVIPRAALVLAGTLLMVLLWNVRGVFVPILGSLFGFALAAAAIAQETRIRRLERRVNELTSVTSGGTLPPAGSAPLQME